MLETTSRTAPFAALAVLALGGAACEDDKAAAPSAPASSAAASAAAPVASAAVPAPPAPPDLDVRAVEKALECSDGKPGPCAVLAAYAACKPWDGSTPSGDGRWLGAGFQVDKGKVTEQITLLRSRRVPAAEVGPGQVPARIGFAKLEPDHPARTAAEKAILALSRHDVPGAKNQAIEYVTALDRWEGEAYATRTDKGSVFALHKGGAFICTGAKQQLVMVLRADTRGAEGDGLYAELWPTTW